jgi:hypothetical protein
MNNNPVIKHKKTHEIRFTKFELLHLRDLMSICLPPEGKHTVSEMLASLENRVIVESALWQKITGACENVGLPTGDDAPDYVVAPSGIAPLGVFQMASSPFAEDDSGEEDDEDEEVTDSSDDGNILEMFKKAKKA